MTGKHQGFNIITAGQIGAVIFIFFLLSPARADVLLDDFEDGSDGGWSVVGHGSFLSHYHKAVVSPGHKSVYALRLTREGPEGWCGVGFEVGKMGLVRCSAIRLAARGAKDVEGLVVDIHCTDGSRWWYKAELKRDGSWTPVEATAERFFPIENLRKQARPDLTKVGALWLTMDKVREKSVGPWSMDIDDVIFVGEAKLPRFAKASGGSAGELRWQGGKVKIGVVDGDAFLPVRPRVGLAKGIVKVLKEAGADAELIEPPLGTGKADMLVLTGPAFAAGDESRVLDHLKAGRALWYIGTGPMFSQPRVKENGAWKPAVKWGGPAELKRILDGPQLSRHWLELAEPQFELTKAGRQWWPEFPTRLPGTKCGFLAADDSIYRPGTPPWVEVTPLVRMRYTSRNWVQQDDLFTGWVVVKFAHQAGPFAGARILFAGMANDPRSVFYPENPAFGPAVVRCARELAEPVRGVWAKTPVAPLENLPELTRGNFFTFPGPVFAPLGFDGIPQNDPAFWEDLDLAGFNAVHVTVPWLARRNAAGEVIDFTVADRYVKQAREHRKKIIFDPYDFQWGRCQWTGENSAHNPEFIERFGGAMEQLAARYRHEPTVVAIFAGSISATYGTFGVDGTESGKKAWPKYVQNQLGLSPVQAGKRYGKAISSWAELPLPEHRKGDKYNLGPMWADYLEFANQSHLAMMRTLINRIRAGAPDMPIMVRGNYLDVGIHFKLAAEFPGVAPHCECVETTLDTEGYFRGLALSFGVPITAENGWPKSRGGPLRMALADYLLGGYSAFLYSFGGPGFARPGILDFHRTQKIARTLRQARYPSTSLGLLIPDTTLYASEPASFFAMEGLPHLEFAMERLGFNFRSVSAQFPDFKGLTILVDDGSNFVLTAECRGKIAAWVRRGGTLIAFPGTGKYDLAGGGKSLEKEFNISFNPQKEPCRIAPVGKGRVIVFSEVPVQKNGLNLLDSLLVKSGARREVVVTPRVNCACFRNGDKTYLVVCNKSVDYVGSYFQESRLPAAEAHLPNLELKLKPNFAFTRARDLVTGKNLDLINGTVTVYLPKTEFTVIEIER